MSDWRSPFCLYTKSRQRLCTRSAIRLRDEYDASSAQADARLFAQVLCCIPAAISRRRTRRRRRRRRCCWRRAPKAAAEFGSGPDMRRLSVSYAITVV